MKTKFLFMLLSSFLSLPLLGQQVQEEETTPIPYAFPQYRKATVTMMFGSKKEVMGNIYLDGSKFYFLKDSIAIEAGLSNISRVAFGDTLYMPVDTSLARIVATKDNKMLICIRTIDKYKMKGSNDGIHGADKRGEGMAFFQLDMFSSMGFIELNPDNVDKSRLFPLKREYYFILDGEIIPAKERPVMKRYTKTQRKVLKGMTENRFWSWKDEQSLVQLLDLL